MLSNFWANRDLFARKGIKILGGYVTVTEHAYYIILQAKDCHCYKILFTACSYTERVLNSCSDFGRMDKDKSTKVECYDDKLGKKKTAKRRA
jgi:hypothetical protein